MFLLDTHAGKINGLAFIPNSRLLAVQSYPRLAFWDLPEQKHRADLGSTGSFYLQSLAIAPDGRTAATMQWPHMLKVWSLETFQELAHLPSAGSGYLRCLTYAGDGKTLFAVGGHFQSQNDLIVRRWDLTQPQKRSRSVKYRLPRRTGSSLSLVVGADGVLAASGCYLGKVTVCGLGKRTVEVAMPERRAFVQVRFSPDGRTLAILRERTVRLWDVATRQVRASWTENRLLHALAFSPGSNILATGGNDGSVKFRDVATGKERASFDWQVGVVSAVAFSPDGMLAAAGGFSGRVVVWDVDQI
jgi:WD40 repeat protein